MDWLDTAIIDSAIDVVKNIAFALIVFLVGWLMIKWMMKWVEKKIEHSKMDVSLKPFISGIVGAGLKVLLILSVISILGIPASSFVAVIAAAGFAIGLAFQGSLANFAGGVLLLTLRPFRVGDTIEGGGFSGKVRAIQILYTILSAEDGKVIYIPNGSLSNAGIVNLSQQDLYKD